MPTAADFRSFAETCKKMACAAAAEATKGTLLNMAAKWNDLAEHADRMRRLVREAGAVLECPDPETEKQQRIRRRFT
jgi:hypothetical protein